MAELTNISLSRGAPSLDIVAVDDLKLAAERAFERDPAGSFAYGTSAGYPRLLEWLAKKHAVAPDRLLATNGSMQADAFLFEELVEPGDVVIVEAPTYDRTLLSLTKLGAEVFPIPLEADGLDVGALEVALEAGARPKLAHVIPNFQNPAGCTLSLDKRRRLVELAREYGFTIFEDDPYVELRFEGEHHPRMLELDESGEAVVYASSFSKTVCPGIRVGYLVGPKELIARIRKRATETYISPNMVAQSIVAEFCDSGAIDRSIETVKAALRERRDATCDALNRHLPDARFVTPQGGYFLWVDLPEGSDVDGARSGLRRARRGVREGHRLPDRGRSELAAVRLLRRAARPDRGGHRARGRGVPGANADGCVIELEQPRDVRALLRDSFTVYLRHFGTFLALGALVVVPSQVIVGGIGLEQLTADYDDTSPSWAETSIAAAVAYLVVAPLITAICVHALRSVAGGGSMGAREAIVKGFEAFTPIFFAVLLAAAGIALGLLLIVPGIYLFVRWYFVPQAVVLEGARNTAALRASTRLVTGAWWRTFGLVRAGQRDRAR